MTPQEVQALIDKTLNDRLRGLNVLSDRLYCERGIEMAPNTYIKTGVAVKEGYFGVEAVGQQEGAGTTSGFSAGAGTPVNNDSAFTGNLGSESYTIGDIVKALKTLGFF